MIEVVTVDAISTIALLVDLTRDLEFGLDHQRTSTALAASEERFRFLAENTGDVVMLSRDGRIEWISPAVRTMLGWEPEDLIGAVFWLLSPASAFVTGVVVPVDGGFSAFSGV